MEETCCGLDTNRVGSHGSSIRFYRLAFRTDSATRTQSIHIDLNSCVRSHLQWSHCMPWTPLSSTSALFVARLHLIIDCISD